MRKSVLTVCAAATLGAAALLPMPTGVAAHGFGGHFSHRFHHHLFSPYGSFVVAEPASVAPVWIDPGVALAPRCTHSRETITVPSEDGGERQITITRC
jgi:hypothetical protein